MTNAARYTVRPLGPLVAGAVQPIAIGAPLLVDPGGHTFDAPGATYTHQPAPDGTGVWCTFETLIAAHQLGDDAALARLAHIVHAADIAPDLNTDPLGPGLLAIGVGGLEVESDDQALLERGMFVYDALYAWCARQVMSPRV